MDNMVIKELIIKPRKKNEQCFDYACLVNRKL